MERSSIVPMQLSSTGTSQSVLRRCREVVITQASLLMFHRLAKELGADPNVILASSHGRRSIDTLQLYDPSKANWNC